MRFKRFFAGLGLFALAAAVVSVIALSSFTGKKDESKTSAVKTEVKKAVQKPGKKAIVKRYWNGSSWQSTPVPGKNCGPNGEVCAGTYDDEVETEKTEEQILDEARILYIATGNLTNPSVNSGTVLVPASSAPGAPTIPVLVEERQP